MMSLLHGVMAINNIRHKKTTKSKNRYRWSCIYNIEFISSVGLVYIQKMIKKKDRSYGKMWEDLS